MDRDPGAMGGRFDRSGVVVMVGSVSIGVAAWFLVRFVLIGFFTVDPNERAVKTILGRAQRLGTATTLDTPLADLMRPDERERYVYRWRPRRSTWRKISRTQRPIATARSCKR